MALIYIFSSYSMQPADLQPVGDEGLIWRLRGVELDHTMRA